MKTTGKTDPFSETIQNSSQAVRKQVTVLFCDIADYTSRTSSMDPEEVAEDIHEFQSICRNVAESYQGHVSNYLGDGVMVLFGHPNASEFSAERAVQAGLAMVFAIRENNFSPEWKNKRPLSIRIGIATGLVVVGDRAGERRDQDELIFGNAPNLAARLQTIAQPNTVVVAFRTRRLVGLAFKFREMGKFNFKGFSRPVSAWQIVAKRKLQKRTGNILKRNSANFISRNTELKLLQQNYESACAGVSRFVHIQGEPGIGKSRLIRRFEKELASDQFHRIRIDCSPYHQNSYLRPVRDEGYRWLRISDEDDIATKQTSMSWAMSVVKLKEIDQHLLFTEFLQLPSPVSLKALNLDPEEKRKRIASILIEVIYTLAKSKPVLLMAEDLHWADPSTLAFIRQLLAHSVDQKVLGILTSRGHFQPEWGTHEALTDIRLEGLTLVESRRLVESVFEKNKLPLGLKQSLVKKSNGIPLFLEESCLSALTHLSKAANLNPVLAGYAIPETLQDSLNARLDQLGVTRRFAQLASTFGENFSFSDISSIANLNNIDANHGLNTLLHENIIVPDSDPSSDRFHFRHLMFQEAAYLSLLIRTRQIYHQQIADLLLKNDPEFSRKYPEVLAHHLSKTKQIAESVELWNMAAEIAIAKSAFLESIEHLQQGLSLIAEIEDVYLHKELELSLLLNLGVSLTASAGYYGFEVTRTYERAIELARETKSDRLEWTALYGYWRCLIAQAEYAESVRTSAKLSALSSRINDPLLTLTCLGIRAMTRLVHGNLRKAVALTKLSVGSQTASQDISAGQRFGQDPFVTILGLGAVSQLLLGKVSTSLISINRSLSVARQVGHPYTIAETLKLASVYEQLSGNMVQLRTHCEEAIALSKRYEFDGVLATHEILLGFANVVTYGDKSRIAIMERNLEIYEQKYGLLFLPYFRSLLAQAHLHLGQYQEAFDVADIILEEIEICGENWVLPTAYCVKSEAAIRGKIANLDNALVWYSNSLETAYNQDSILLLSRHIQSDFFYSLAPVVVEKYRTLLAQEIGTTKNVNHDLILQKH